MFPYASYHSCNCKTKFFIYLSSLSVRIEPLLLIIFIVFVNIEEQNKVIYVDIGILFKLQAGCKNSHSYRGILIIYVKKKKKKMKK